MALLVALALALSCAEGKHTSPAHVPAADAGDGPTASSMLDAEPPRIEDVAFVRDDARGPRVLVRGIDPRQRIEWVHLEFFDGKGNPVTNDDDGDGIEDASIVDVSVTERAPDGRFFVEVQSARGFDAKARQVIVSPVGGMANAAEKHVAALALPSARALGQSCDPQGFDTCAGGAVCAPGKVGGTNRCARGEDVRSTRCADAPRLVAGMPATLTVDAWGSSAWEPPAGCVSPDRWGRPEALVWLHVKDDVSHVMIDTAGENGSVDTVLSVLSGCGTEGDAIACNDDHRPPSSRVTLRNVTAGDYLLVVDTLDRAGGRVSVRASSW